MRKRGLTAVLLLGFLLLGFLLLHFLGGRFTNYCVTETGEGSSDSRSWYRVGYHGSHQFYDFEGDAQPTPGWAVGNASRYGYDALFLVSKALHFLSVAPQDNPSFETGDITSWDERSTSDTAPFWSNCTVTDSRASHGNYSLKLNVKASAGGFKGETLTDSILGWSLARNIVLRFSFYIEKFENTTRLRDNKFALEIQTQRHANETWSTMRKIELQLFEEGNTQANDTYRLFKNLNQTGNIELGQWHEASYNITELAMAYWTIPVSELPEHKVRNLVIQAKTAHNASQIVYVDDFKVAFGKVDNTVWSWYKSMVDDLRQSENYPVYPATEIRTCGTVLWGELTKIVGLNYSQAWNDSLCDPVSLNMESVKNITERNPQAIFDGDDDYFQYDLPNCTDFSGKVILDIINKNRIQNLTKWDGLLLQGYKIPVVGTPDAHNATGILIEKFHPSKHTGNELGLDPHYFGHTMLYTYSTNLSDIQDAALKGNAYAAKGVFTYANFEALDSLGNTLGIMGDTVTQPVHALRITVQNSSTLQIANITVRWLGYNETYPKGIFKVYQNLTGNQTIRIDNISGIRGPVRVEVWCKTPSCNPSIIISNPIYLEPTTPALEYIDHNNANVTSAIFTNRSLIYVLTTPSKVSSTAKIYCGNYSRPSEVKFASSYSYDPKTRILTVTVQCQGSRQIEISWSSRGRTPWLLNLPPFLWVAIALAIVLVVLVYLWARR
jgi:hypothetical protein